MSISLIIPVKNDYESFKKVFTSCLNQSLKPKEIIIVDSSNNNLIEDYLESVNTKISVLYNKQLNKYPGEARNIGIKKAKYEYIAFIDSKTIPINNWLEIQFNKLKNYNYDVVFGSTQYMAKNYIQELIRAATFGKIKHITTPGSLVRREVALKNFFIERVRTSDDLEWRERLVKKNNRIASTDITLTKYESLPNSIILLLKRYFIYSYHTAQVNVDNKTKFFYFFFISILIFLIIPRWNQYLPNWNIYHPLYIHNQTKFFILVLLIVFILVIFIQNLNFLNKGFFQKFIKFFFIITCIILVYNWNYSIANLINEYTLFIPHITKIFLVLLFLTSFILRGIYYPTIRNVNKSLIFPYAWIYIGLIGLLIDLIKAPSYFYGAILPTSFLRKDSYINNENTIIFYPKYGEQSPSYRIRFLSYKTYLEKNNLKVKTKELFNESFYNKKIYQNKIKKIKLIYFYFRRVLDLLFRKKPFIAITHVELLPYIPFIAELILKLRKISYIVDVDDAVYLRFKNRNRFLYLLDKIKFNYMFKNAYYIYAGNLFHVNYIKNINSNILYIPTIIDFEKYKTNLYIKKNRTFTVVWIGTPSTSSYLMGIIPILNKLKDEININIKLIGADKNLLNQLNCEFVEWDINSEVHEISECHLGIMPLHDTMWELGKCGYKILQYMSLKLPVVASPIGVNKEIIKDNFNGMLAKNDEDWYNKIKILIDKPSLYNKISTNGYKTAKENFDLNLYKELYLKNIKKNNLK